MKNKSTASTAAVVIVLAAIAGFTPFTSLGQQSSAIRPDTYYIVKADKSLTVLPSATGDMKGKGKLGGLAGVKSIVDIPGEAAAVRLRAGEPQTFVLGVQTALPESIPNTLYAMLHKLDVKRGKREWVAGDVTSYYVTAKARGFDPRGIPLNFARFDTQAIKIEPRTPLPPGEYAFVSLDSDPYRPNNEFRLHCFGVDPQ